MRLASFAIFLAMSFCAVGCGSTPVSTYPVTGTVTRDGKPLADGTVYFKTVTTGAVDTMNVVDGKFTGMAQAGERRVEVHRFRNVTVTADGMTSEAQVDDIPLRFNAKSTLTAVVTPQGPNEFAFSIDSK